MTLYRKVILLWVVMVVGLTVSWSSISAQSKPFWKKLSFALGFSYARCLPGNHLDEYDAAAGLSAFSYPLKMLEVSAQYPILKNTGVEIGAGYAWFPSFNNASGLYLPLPGGDSQVHASDFEISGGEGFLRWHAGKYLFFEGAAYFCKVMCQEYSDTSSSTAKRYCWGPTFGFGIQHPHFLNEQIRVHLKLRFGGAKEYKNDSIWDWDERLNIGLTGLDMGIDLQFPVN